MRNLLLEVITPEKVVFEGEARMVSVPTSAGIMGILPGHMPLLTRLTPGGLKIVRQGKPPLFIAISSGFIQIRNNGVTILADTAESAESINEAKAKEARERAKNLLKQKLSDVDFARVEAELRKALAELRTVRMKRWRKSTPQR